MCRIDLQVGQWAHWSPSQKSVWCGSCAGGQRRSPSETSLDPLKRKSGQGLNRGDSTRTGALPPSHGGLIDPWERLCRYAQRCVEAEAAKLLVPYSKEGVLWFHHAGPETLVVGRSDSVPAPEPLAKALSASDGRRDGHCILYGWPLVIMLDRDHRSKVAPLFAVRIETERRASDDWLLHASSEPEFNSAITASGVFDPSVGEEIDNLVADGLPFGDAEAFAELAKRMAHLLLLDGRSPLDARSLQAPAHPDLGIHNAAAWFLTETAAHTATLIDELRSLRRCKDWTSTAAAWLVPGSGTPSKEQRLGRGPLAAPLLCSLSQEYALDALRKEPLTIVTGPPGTGKTQFVVNAVVNVWLDGEKVLVTSTNNAAVDVAVDRAGQEVGDGLLMRTGNRAVREQVADRITAASGEASAYEGDLADRGRASLRQAAAARDQLTEQLAALDKLDDDLLTTAEKLGAARVAAKRATQRIWTDGVRPDASLDAARTGRRARRLLRTWFFRSLRTRRLRQRLGCVATATLEEIAEWALRGQQQAMLEQQLNMMRIDRRKLGDAVGDPAEAMRSVDARWRRASDCAIRAEMALRIRRGADRLAAFGTASCGGKGFRQAVGRALASLRGWACTALSANPNFPLEAGLFDLVIVDEASQCSLAAVLPLAYRAKRLAVVGDPGQLHPIVPLGDQFLSSIAAETGFDNDDLRRLGLHHKDGSAYFAFEHAARAREPILLDEHYRCHPQIARWFNRTFYKDKLTVLTEIDEPARGRCRTILWEDVNGAAERSENDASWVNRAEAERTLERLAETLDSGVTVGVVTPFAAQAELIGRIARERFQREFLDEAGFVCGTAHRLQGNERDVVIISAVLSPNMRRSAASWLERERNLVNVAVSRARTALIVLGHPDVGGLGSPTLASLRTYLREEMAVDKATEEGSGHFRTDSRSEELLLRAMQRGNLLPYAKLNVEGYELDFALMERGIQLNVEVDGDQHLDARGRRRRQDLTRDRVLSKLGWKVLRVPAWRCHEEMDSVIQEIDAVRNELLGMARPPG